MAKILILGGGFAAITAAEMLSATVGVEHEITLVSVNRSFTFFPALVPLVFGDFRPDEIHFDMVPKLSRRRIRFIQGEVISINPVLRTVQIVGDDIEGDVHFDSLLIAIGRRLATERTPGFFEYAHHLLGLGPALKFKNAIANFESGSIVVGLCPGAFLPVPVCEAALALATKFERQIADREVTVTAIFPQTLERAFAGAGLFRDVESAFEQRGIKLISDFPIDHIDEDKIVSKLRPPIDYDLLMLVPPFRGQIPVERLSSPANDDGFAKVNSRMQVEGFDGIYAAGDIVSLPGPRFGYMAMRQAKVAAINIFTEISGEEPTMEYSHKIAWILGEKYTHPAFFHYGFWDETLEDFDEDALLGMARRIRERYGPVRPTDDRNLIPEQMTDEE